MPLPMPDPGTLSTVKQCDQAIEKAEELVKKYRLCRWVITHGRETMYIVEADISQNDERILLWDDLYTRWLLILPEKYSGKGNHGVCQFLLDNGWVESSQLDCEQGASYIYFESTGDMARFIRKVNHWVRNAEIRSIS